MVSASQTRIKSILEYYNYYNLRCDKWTAAFVCAMYNAGKDIPAGYYEKLRRRDLTPSLSLPLFLPFFLFLGAGGRCDHPLRPHWIRQCFVRLP